MIIDQEFPFSRVNIIFSNRNLRIFINFFDRTLSKQVQIIELEPRSLPNQTNQSDTVIFAHLKLNDSLSTKRSTKY